jgi:hypothetical protein
VKRAEHLEDRLQNLDRNRILHVVDVDEKNLVRRLALADFDASASCEIDKKNPSQIIVIIITVRIDQSQIGCFATLEQRRRTDGAGWCRVRR